MKTYELRLISHKFLSPMVNFIPDLGE